MMQLECDKLQDKIDLVVEEKQAMQKNLEDVFNQLTCVQMEVSAFSVQRLQLWKF